MDSSLYNILFTGPLEVHPLLDSRTCTWCVRLVLFLTSYLPCLPPRPREPWKSRHHAADDVLYEEGEWQRKINFTGGD